MIPPVKPKKKPGKAAQFSLDMDAKGIVALLVMLSLSLATAFYLGMVFGKAQRVPGLEPVPGAEAPAQPEAGAAAGTTPAEQPKDLQIYQIKEDPSGLEDLKTDFQRMKEETDQVNQDETQREAQTKALEQAQDQGGLALEDDAAKAKPKAKPAEEPKANGEDWAGKVLSDNPPKPTEPQWTIQVMATRSKPKADGLVTQLKRKGFDAYIDEVKVEGTSMYRLRVGKDSEDKINKVQKRLKDAGKGLDSEFKIVRLN